MARPGQEEPKELKLEELQKQITEINQFNKKLLEALELAEVKLQKLLKDQELYLIPSGTWYGKTY